MRRVFVSCQSIDAELPHALIEGLNAKGFHTDTSPRNPSDGPDSKWLTWYETEMLKAIGNSDAFVIVVDEGWDSSTWMAMELEEALKRNRNPNDRLLVAMWNPQGIHVNALGKYLQNQLPSRIDLPNGVEKAIEALTRRCS